MLFVVRRTEIAESPRKLTSFIIDLSLISVKLSVQSALYRSLLTHITALHPPPPLSVTLTDADIASAHLHS